MKIIQAFLLVILLNSSAHTPLYENQKKIDFCDIPKYVDKQVYIKCIYSGVDEYWSLSPINEKCKDDIRVEFENPTYELPILYREKFSTAHEYYWKYYLILELVGTFETGKHYGHLGSNNYLFKVNHIIKAELIHKKKRR